MYRYINMGILSIHYILVWDSGATTFWMVRNSTVTTWLNIFPGTWMWVFIVKKIRGSWYTILWASWQFYSDRVWKSDRKEVQKTEQNPKKTQKLPLEETIKRGKGNRVSLLGASIEMLSVPGSELTVQKKPPEKHETEKMWKQTRKRRKRAKQGEWHTIRETKERNGRCREEDEIEIKMRRTGQPEKQAEEQRTEEGTEEWGSTEGWMKWTDNCDRDSLPAQLHSIYYQRKGGQEIKENWRRCKQSKQKRFHPLFYHPVHSWSRCRGFLLNSGWGDLNSWIAYILDQNPPANTHVQSCNRPFWFTCGLCIQPESHNEPQICSLSDWGRWTQWNSVIANGSNTNQILISLFPNVKLVQSALTDHQVWERW